MAGALALHTQIAQSLVDGVYHLGLQRFVGDPWRTALFLGFFCSGACFRLYRDRIGYRPSWVAAATIIGICLFFIAPVSDLAMMTLGGYVLFWIAFKVNWKPLRTLNAKDDISYGVYLWAWPISTLLLWYWPDPPLLVLMALTTVGAAACGWISWHLIEKPALGLKPK
jgi:peptidoglycan/LPS O-acetylase OafA/YrhL